MCINRTLLCCACLVALVLVVGGGATLYFTLEHAMAHAATMRDRVLSLAPLGGGGGGGGTNHTLTRA